MSGLLRKFWFSENVGVRADNYFLYCRHATHLVQYPILWPTPVFAVPSIINPRRACARVIVVVLSVCVCICLSVKSHLASGASVRPENTVKY